MKTRTSRTFALVSSIAVVCFAVPGSLRGAAISIVDTNPDNTVTITAANFDRGAFQGGGTFAETGAPLHFSGAWLHNLPAEGAGHHTIYLLESAAAGAPISDILDYTITDNSGQVFSIDGTFQSDVEGSAPLLPLPPDPNGDVRVVVEDGSAVGFSATNLSGGVQSDVDAVPLPASVWGGVVLMGGLLVSRLKRKTQLA